MKKNKIKNLIIEILLWLVAILTLIGIVKVSIYLDKQNDKAFNECIKYHSKNRCAKGIYGVYP